MTTIPCQTIAGVNSCAEIGKISGVKEGVVTTKRGGDEDTDTLWYKLMLEDYSKERPVQWVTDEKSQNQEAYIFCRDNIKMS